VINGAIAFWPLPSTDAAPALCFSEAKPLTSTAGHHVKKLARKPTPMEVT